MTAHIISIHGTTAREVAKEIARYVRNGLEHLSTGESVTTPFSIPNGKVLVYTGLPPGRGGSFIEIVVDVFIDQDNGKVKQSEYGMRVEKEPVALNMYDIAAQSTFDMVVELLGTNYNG